MRRSQASADPGALGFFWIAARRSLRADVASPRASPGSERTSAPSTAAGAAGIVFFSVLSSWARATAGTRSSDANAMRFMLLLAPFLREEDALVLRALD